MLWSGLLSSEDSFKCCVYIYDVPVIFFYIRRESREDEVQESVATEGSLQVSGEFREIRVLTGFEVIEGEERDGHVRGACIRAR